MSKKVTLVVGNGFDLNLGLKTSYSDFINGSKSFIESSYGGPGMDLNKYLKKVHSINNWIDLEKELKEFSNSQADNVRKSDFVELSNQIKEYLIGVDLELKKKSIDFIKSTSSFKVLNEIVSTKSYEILNFNYTSSVEYILENILGVSKEEIQKRLFYIHGSLLKDNIIIGVEEEFENAEKYPFLVKFMNEKFDTTININAKLKESWNVVFYGHSLGETDHSHFNSFFRDISKEEDIVSVKRKIGVFMFYFGSNDWDKKARELRRLTNSRYRILLDNNEFRKIDLSETVINFNRDFFVKDSNARIYPIKTKSLNRGK